MKVLEGLEGWTSRKAFVSTLVMTLSSPYAAYTKVCLYILNCDRI